MNRSPRPLRYTSNGLGAGQKPLMRRGDEIASGRESTAAGMNTGESDESC